MAWSPQTIQTKELVKDPKKLVEHYQQTLNDVFQAQNDAVDRVLFTRFSVPPARPEIGAIYYADGTNWNPGSGQGLYIYSLQSVYCFLGTDISVRNFGAIGNGIQDDSAAFTAAGSVAAKVTVVVPRGTYLINTAPTPTGIVIWDIKAGAIFTGPANAYFTAAGNNDQKTQVVTTGTDVATHYIRRNANHTGGTPGFINAALRVDTYCASAVSNYEWSFLATMNNSAPGGENVAGYMQAIRNVATAGPTFGAVVEVIELPAINNPTAGLVSLEVDNRSNGTDSLNQRIGIDVVIARRDTAGPSTQAGFGYRLQTGRDVNSSAKVGYGFDIGVKCDVGMDFSNAVMAQAAIKVAANQAIAFDVSAINTISYDTAGLTYAVSGVKKSRLVANGSIDLFGLRTNLSGNFSSGTTAPVMTSSKPGTTTAIYTWMDMSIDGVAVCFPVWQKA